MGFIAECINAFPTILVTPALNFPTTFGISYFIVGKGFIPSVFMYDFAKLVKDESLKQKNSVYPALE